MEEAVSAAEDKKALHVNVLDLHAVSSFTDFFLICSGTSTRHMQAICDGVIERLERFGIFPSHVEGYAQAEWILVDYVDFVVHIFSEKAREFYDLERLWKKAPRIRASNGGG